MIPHLKFIIYHCKYNIFLTWFSVVCSSRLLLHLSTLHQKHILNNHQHIHENDTTKGNKITIFKRYIINLFFPKTKDKSYQTVPRLTVNGTVRIPFDLPRLILKKNYRLFTVRINLTNTVETLVQIPFFSFLLNFAWR